MKPSVLRLRKVQMLAHEIMDEINLRKKERATETLNLVIDTLSRAVGDLTDPSGNYSLDYLEEKVGKCAFSIVQKEKSIKKTVERTSSTARETFAHPQHVSFYYTLKAYISSWQAIRHSEKFSEYSIRATTPLPSPKSRACQSASFLYFLKFSHSLCFFAFSYTSYHSG